MAWDLPCPAVSRKIADICSYRSSLAVRAYQVHRLRAWLYSMKALAKFSILFIPSSQLMTDE